jgi:hypothetical protein
VSQFAPGPAPDDETDWDAVVPCPGPPGYGPPPHTPSPQYPSSYGSSSYGSSSYGSSSYPPPSYAPPPPAAAGPGSSWSPPPGYGVPTGYGAPPGYGPPPWGWYPPPPPRPQRPGTSIAAAVLAFTLALLTLLGSVYAAAFSALLSIARRPAGALDSWTPFAQLLVVLALVAGGALVLGGRRALLLAAAAAEVVLAVWWLVVLGDIAVSGLSGGLGALPLLFAALAAVAAGLTFSPSARRWADEQRARRAAAGAGRQPPGGS